MADEVERLDPDAQCEKCPLYKGYSAYAPGVGPKDAKVVMVGEAPGYYEAEKGEPFVGISGKLLNIVLDHHNIDRQEVRLTNAVLCRPRKNANPNAAALAACKPRLKRELAEAETIVALGKVAADAIEGTPGKITQRRVGPASLLPTGQRFVATVHPAATLRQPDMFPFLVNDMGKVMSQTTTGWEEPTYVVYDTPKECIDFLIEALNSRYEVFALDIEVGVDKDDSFTHPRDLLCIGLSYKANTAVVLGERGLRHARVWKLMGQLVKNKKILCHNGKFDLQVLHNLMMIEEPALDFDTMLASYCLDERPGTHGLKYLAKEELGAPAYDDELKRYIGPKDSFADVPRPALYKYNAYDAALTFNLWTILEERMEKEGLRGLHDYLVRASNELSWVESGGLKVDKEYLDTIAQEYTSKIEQLDEALRPWVGNPRSPQQVKATLAEFGHNVTTTNEQMLRELLERATGDLRKFLELMLESRRTGKLYGTYIKGTRKRLHQGRVYPTLLLHGTTTGRLACRNPNLQNVPRESTIRRLFVPAEGHTFVQGDYKAAELRVVATEARDPYLRSVFAEGRDLHSEVAERFFGADFTKDQRVRAKAVVFGLMYGREAFSLAQEFKISPEEAQGYISDFFAMVPATARWRKSISQSVLKENKTLQTAFDRQRRFWLITRENKHDVEKEALAFIPQSTASDITLSALVRLRQAGLVVRIPVHDSILVECRHDQANDVAQYMREIMEETAREQYTDFVPFVAETEQGKSWGDLTTPEVTA